MKEIIDRIFKEEDDAEKKIAYAKAKAEDMVSQAKKDARRIFDETVTAATDYAKKKVQETETESSLQKAKVIEETRRNVSALTKEKAKDIEKIARQIFDAIIEIKE